MMQISPKVQETFIHKKAIEDDVVTRILTN